jgi:DNA-binding phage protein
MPKTVRPYNEWLLQQLRDPKKAIEYLNGILEDAPELFPKALAKVSLASEASSLSHYAGAQPVTLDPADEGEVDSNFNTVTGLLQTLGLRLTVGSARAGKVQQAQAKAA